MDGVRDGVHNDARAGAADGGGDGLGVVAQRGVEWWVGCWVDVVPSRPVASALLALVATALLVALMASVVHRVAFVGEYSARSRLGRRVDTWHWRFDDDQTVARAAPRPVPLEVPLDVLDRWAKRELRRATGWSRVRAVSEAFGGWTFTLSQVNLLAALRPWNLAAAAGVVYVGWPDVGERSSVTAGFESTAGDLWQRFTGVPVAAIVLVVVMVTLMPRTPLVDHIRARDEAAKAANARLAELAAAMAELLYSVGGWRETFGGNRHRYVRGMVETHTSWQRTWSQGKVVTPSLRQEFGMALRRGVLEPPARFCDAYARVLERRRELQSAGVAVVAWRLSGAALMHLKITQIHWYFVPRDADLDGVFHPPENINAFFASYRPLGEWVPEEPAVSWAEDSLEDAARNAVRVMDRFAADLALAELALQKGVNHLNGRMVGRWWLRVLGATQR